MRIRAVVEPPLQLFKVAIQTLCADLVEHTDDGALEQAPDAFDAIRAHVSDDPLFGRVPGNAVLCVGVSDAQVGEQFIGVDRFGPVLDMAVDEGVQGGLAEVLSN